MRRTSIHRALGLALAAAILLPAGVAYAGTPTSTLVFTADGNGADTELQNDNQGCDGTDPICTAGVNSGGDALLDMRRLDGTRQKMVLLRFDISDLDPSDYADAQLGFDFTSNRNRDVRVYGIADGLDNWDESTVTYLDAPGILDVNDTPAGADAVAAEIGLNPTELFPGHTTGGGPNPFQLGVISIFDSEPAADGSGDIPGQRAVAVSDPSTLPLGPFLTADTDGLVTLLMFLDVSNGNPNALILAKEGVGQSAPTSGNGLSPMLGIIPQSLVPEPTSALLAAVAMAGFAARRR